MYAVHEFKPEDDLDELQVDKKSIKPYLKGYAAKEATTIKSFTRRQSKSLSNGSESMVKVEIGSTGQISSKDTCIKSTSLAI